MDENQSITRNFLNDYVQLECRSICRLRLRKEIERIYTLVEHHKWGSTRRKTCSNTTRFIRLFFKLWSLMKFTEKKKENWKITWKAKKTDVWENFIHAISRCQKRLISGPTSSQSLPRTTIKDQVLFSKQTDIVVFNVWRGKAEVGICSEHSELVEDKKMRLNHARTLLSKWESKTMEMKFPEGNTECLFYTTAHCSWNILFRNVLMGGCRQASSIDYYFSDILNLMVR